MRRAGFELVTTQITIFKFNNQICPEIRLANIFFINKTLIFFTSDIERSGYEYDGIGKWFVLAMFTSSDA